MGVINHDAMTLSSGLQLSNCYLSFTPGPLQFPQEPDSLSLKWSVGPTGEKMYKALATLYIYTSRDGKAAGLAPLEQRTFVIQEDFNSPTVIGTFETFYAFLKTQFANTEDTPPVQS